MPVNISRDRYSSVKIYDYLVDVTPGFIDSIGKTF